MSPISVVEMFREQDAELRRMTERHPYWSNVQIADAVSRRSGRLRLPVDDVESMRVYLGKPFPEGASHDYRQRMLWHVARFMGLESEMEFGVGRRRADLVVWSNAYQLVIEVKSGRATREAVPQVVHYREGLGVHLAAISAPTYHPSTLADAEAAGVLCLNGERTIELLGLIASANALNGTTRTAIRSAA